MKKLLALLMTFVLTASLLAGCTPEEMSFLQLNQKISALDAYTMTGSLDWDTDLEALMSTGGGDPEMVASQREFIRVVNEEGLKHITFSYGVDMKNNALEARYSAGGQELFSLLLVKDVYYVNFDGLLEMIKKNDTQTLQNTAVYEKLETLKGKYLSMSVQELMLSGVSPSDMIKPEQLQNSLARQQAFGKNMTGYFIDFAKAELTEYNPGLVKKAYDSSVGADVYSYNVKLDELPLLAMNLMLVLLDHLDGTEALVTKIVTDPVFASQAGMDTTRMASEVKTGFAQIRENLPATKMQLTAMISQEESTASLSSKIKEMIGNVTMETKVADLGSQKYWNKVSITLDNPSGKMPLKKASLDAEVTVDASKSPVIAVPANVVPFRVFNSTLPHTLTLEPDSQTASYEEGLLPDRTVKVNMKNIGGYWFISTGSLPEYFKAMVKQEGASYSVGGKVLTGPQSIQTVGDATYISISAFRNAGVTVTWDAVDRTLTLEK